MDKAEARECCRQAWKDFFLDGKTEALLGYFVSFFGAFTEDIRLLVFLPLQDEVHYLHLLKGRDNLHLYAPRTTKSGMKFYHYEQESTTVQLERGYHGICQPKASAAPLQLPLLPQDQVILPSLGLGTGGIRLGRGGGYYDKWRDRFSENNRITLVPSTLTQLDFPEASHDISVTHAITEKGILEYSNLKSK